MPPATTRYTPIPHPDMGGACRRQLACEQPESATPPSTLLRSAKKKMGRPLIEIDHAQVERLAAIMCTDAEIAAVIGCSVDTLTRRKADDAEFLEILQRGRATACVALRRLQWQRAKAGSDTMCIWLGKQMLGQTDKQVHTCTDGQQLFPAVTVLFGKAEEVAPPAPVTISFDAEQQ